MAEHVWSVFCQSGAIDRATGIVSLLQVLETINIEIPPDKSKEVLDSPENLGKLLRLDAQVVSWWVRSDPEKEEQGEARIYILTPKGEKVATSTDPMNLDFEKFGYRTHTRVQGFPYMGTGLYWIVVELLSKKKKWMPVARLPVTVSATVRSQPSAQPRSAASL